MQIFYAFPTFFFLSFLKWKEEEKSQSPEVFTLSTNYGSAKDVWISSGLNAALKVNQVCWFNHPVDQKSAYSQGV